MELQGRNVDQWGNVVFSTDGLIDHLMRGSELSNELVANPVDGVMKFNALCKELDHPDDQVAIYTEPNIPVKESDVWHQSQWFTPEPYASLDVQEWLFEKCQTQEQVERVLLEWNLYEERNMVPVLRFLVYAMDNFRERNVVCGVGRGSSAASYILYLIGVHRVDSMRWDLDIREFLK